MAPLVAMFDRYYPERRKRLAGSRSIVVSLDGAASSISIDKGSCVLARSTLSREDIYWTLGVWRKTWIRGPKGERNQWRTRGKCLTFSP